MVPLIITTGDPDRKHLILAAFVCGEEAIVSRADFRHNSEVPWL